MAQYPPPGDPRTRPQVGYPPYPQQLVPPPQHFSSPPFQHGRRGGPPIVLLALGVVAGAILGGFVVAVLVRSQASAEHARAIEAQQREIRALQERLASQPPASGPVPQPAPKPAGESQPQAERPRVEREKKPAKEKPRNDPPRIDQPLQMGPLRITVKRVAIDHVPLEDPFRTSRSQEKLLLIELELKNTSQSKRVMYRGFSNSTSIFSSGGGRDEHDNQYRSINFGIGTHIAGEKQGDYINPGQTAQGFIVLEAPIEASTRIDLDFDGQVVDADKQRIRWRLLREDWQAK